MNRDIDNKTSQLLREVEMNTVLIGKYDETANIYRMKDASHILMFDILPLCDEPSIVRELEINRIFGDIYDKEEKYIGLSKDQSKNIGLPTLFSPYSNDFEEIKNELNDYYENQFIIFSPIYRGEIKGEIHKNLKIREVINIPPPLQSVECFEVIPSVNYEIKAFEKKLLKGEFISLDSYSGLIQFDLLFVICDSTLYYCDSWIFDEKDPTSWRCSNVDTATITKCEIEKKTKIITSKNRGIYFIDKDYVNEMIGKAEVININKMIEPVIDNPIENNGVEQEHRNPEYEMLSEFQNNVINNNLCYEFKDLINLHTCAKSSQLTILAGMSGTGKTQLALQYAEMIDAQVNNKTLLFLPISPAYTEPDDILGFLNPSNGLYTPSETGLVDFLVAARDKPDKMHMIIFDEMNLSQIEHWFSPFISILEVPEDKRYLSLYNSNAHCINKLNYPDQIKINSNLIFIGTINLDETTKDISDRLLDRSFVINLKKKKFIDFHTQDSRRETNDTQKTNVCESATMYNLWRSNKGPFHSLNKNEIEFLDNLHEIISEYDEQKGVSFRVLKNIGTYINNIPKDNYGNVMIEKNAALDLVLKQTVMKKIAGPDNRIGELVGKIDKIGDAPINSKIIELFKQYSEISEFEECKKTLKRKAEDLLTYGYTR